MKGPAIALRMMAAVTLAACTAVPACAADGDTGIDFAEHELGLPPEDFDFVVTGRGQPGQWTMVRDTTAIHGVAVEQSSQDPTEDRFPLAVYARLSPKNFRVSVRFKITKGEVQGAGIAARFRDADNYYFVRASALQETVDLFRVVNGRAERIWGTDADVTLYHWHKLLLVAEHDQFTVSFDNDWLFTALDRTFLTDGRIGLWTEEDTVARFDQLEITTQPWSEER